MPKFVCFLRAINVGGHTVTMAELRRLFERAGLAGVETFIASGNVIFDSRAGDDRSQERKVEAFLHKALGYEVATFIRSVEEVHAITRHKPFTDSQRQSALTLNVGLLSEPASAAAKRSLLAYRSDTDDFHVHGREAYWLTKTRQSDSPFFKVGLEKALGMRATVRGMNTIVRLAAKYPLAASH